MENNFTQGGPRKMTAEEYKELTREKSAPPPSPVGIDVEALAKAKVEEMMGYGKYNDNWDYADKHEREKLISVFKAGYSASLPSSSVTGEEDRETKRQPIEDALYATKRFLTTEATDLADGILDYLNDYGFTVTKSIPVTGDRECEAIEMIKWIRENYEPEFGDGRHWEDILDEKETPIADDELYNLYKQKQ